MQDLPEISVERFARVAKLLRTQRTLPAKLETVVAIAKRTVPNCDSAGIMLMIDGQPTTSAVSDRLAVEIDLVQYETGQGPCLSAMQDSHVVRIDVLERDSRFTRFAPGALDRDIDSVMSLPLPVGNTVIGALNLYSRLPNAFDRQSEQVRSRSPPMRPRSSARPRPADVGPGQREVDADGGRLGHRGAPHLAAPAHGAVGTRTGVHRRQPLTPSGRVAVR